MTARMDTLIENDFTIEKKVEPRWVWHPFKQSHLHSGKLG